MKPELGKPELLLSFAALPSGDWHDFSLAAGHSGSSHNRVGLLLPLPYLSPNFSLQERKEYPQLFR